MMQSQVRFNRVLGRVLVVQSQVRFNRVPEKVPEKVYKALQDLRPFNSRKPS